MLGKFMQLHEVRQPSRPQVQYCLRLAVHTFHFCSIHFMSESDVHVFLDLRSLPSFLSFPFSLLFTIMPRVFFSVAVEAAYSFWTAPCKNCCS